MNIEAQRTNNVPEFYNNLTGLPQTKVLSSGSLLGSTTIPIIKTIRDIHDFSTGPYKVAHGLKTSFELKARLHSGFTSKDAWFSAPYNFTNLAGTFITITLAYDDTFVTMTYSTNVFTVGLAEVELYFIEFYL